MKSYKLAVLPADGIGAEVVTAALVPVRAAASKYGFSLAQTHFEWSCECYIKTGGIVPKNGLKGRRALDAILLGAVGWPARVPDDVSLHRLLLPIHKRFDLFVNMRPPRSLPGVDGPLQKSHFDILYIRENTKGEYSGAGGRIHVGTPNKVATETSIFNRRSVERILRIGFEQARKRIGLLASVTKSNAQKTLGGPL